MGSVSAQVAARNPHPGAQEFLDRFARIAATSGAGPTLNVRYRREAWASQVDDYARVTFDRGIEAQRAFAWDLKGDPNGWLPFDEHWRHGQRGRTVVLELKCLLTVPWWIGELVRGQALKRSSFSKYSIGIFLTGRAVGEAGLGRRSSRVMQ